MCGLDLEERRLPELQLLLVTELQREPFNFTVSEFHIECPSAWFPRVSPTLFLLLSVHARKLTRLGLVVNADDTAGIDFAFKL